MARAVEDHWQGELSGIVVTRYGHGVACSRIEVVEGPNPAVFVRLSRLSNCVRSSRLAT